MLQLTVIFLLTEWFQRITEIAGIVLSLDPKPIQVDEVSSNSDMIIT